jgi:hypothetical protein
MDENLKNFYQKLLEVIYPSSLNQKIHIFTTNYDQSIEQYCTLIGIECLDGFKHDPVKKRYLWDKGYYEHYVTKNNTQKIYLYKLHGSLNWKFHKSLGIERTSVESFRNDGNYSDNLLIYPAMSIKKEKKNDPYASIHQTFEQEMSKANGCIVIGYSFRDEDINEIFTKFLDSGKWMIAISPNAESDIQFNLLKKRKPNVITGVPEIIVESSDQAADDLAFRPRIA